MKEKWDCQGKVWAKETRAGTSGRKCALRLQVGSNERMYKRG